MPKFILSWLPIFNGFNGPYVMRPLLPIYYASQVAFSRGTPSPQLIFWAPAGSPAGDPGRWFPLIPFIPYYPVPARDHIGLKGLLAGGISH